MSNDDASALDRDPRSLWDRIWRGKSSRHRRALTNTAVYAARCAASLGEAARLIDQAPSDRRKAEGLALALQIRDLAEGLIACANHLDAEFRDG